MRAKIKQTVTDHIIRRSIHKLSFLNENHNNPSTLKRRMSCVLCLTPQGRTLGWSCSITLCTEESKFEISSSLTRVWRHARESMIPQHQSSSGTWRWECLWLRIFCLFLGWVPAPHWPHPDRGVKLEENRLVCNFAGFMLQQDDDPKHSSKYFQLVVRNFLDSTVHGYDNNETNCMQQLSLNVSNQVNKYRFGGGTLTFAFV